MGEIVFPPGGCPKYCPVYAGRGEGDIDPRGKNSVGLEADSIIYFHLCPGVQITVCEVPRLIALTRNKHWFF